MNRFMIPKCFIKESEPIQDWNENIKFIFKQKKSVFKIGTTPELISIFPLVFNILNNVGIICLECSR